MSESLATSKIGRLLKTVVNHATSEQKGNVAQTNRSFLKWQEYSTMRHYKNNTATYNKYQLQDLTYG